MSHTTEVEAVIITDIDALRTAIAELKSKGVNCDLLENATPRAFFNNQKGMEQASWVVKLHDSKYDVGLYQREDGGYAARTDFYSSEVSNILGVTAQKGESSEQAKLGKLYNAYAVAAATRQAMMQGYSVNRIDMEDGSTQLQIAVN